MEKDLICIGCPLGCSVKVEMEEEQIVSVTGNTCKKGDTYARTEVTNPTRIVTSTVQVENGTIPVVSVKTTDGIPKDKIKVCIEELKGIKMQAPVHIGDIVKENVAKTDINVVATKSVKAERT